MAARRYPRLGGYTDAKMDLDDAHIGDEAEASPAPEEPAPSRGAQDETTPAPGATPGGKKRRSWKRWVANLMIIAGVLLLAYPLGTWAYTWYEQRGLREQLETENPGMVASSSGLRSEDFISVEERAANAEQSAAAAASAAATAAERAAAEAAILAAEQERQAQLDAFEAAADAFEEQLSGTGGEPIGKIIIPSIRVDVIMLEGTDTRDLREGPGHWPETPLPGQGGNFVVSGHRTTYGAPFRKFDKVKEGDLVELVLPYAVARYRVSRVVIVKPNEMEAVAQLGREQVSLAACHPLYSASKRIVVQGELISFSSPSRRAERGGSSFVRRGSAGGFQCTLQ